MDPSQLIALIPSLAPPPGEISNFVDPTSLAPAGRIVVGLTLALMYLFLAVRIYTRTRVTYTFGADDVLCIASAIAITGYSSVVFWKLGNPLGPHQWNVPLIKLDYEILASSLTTMVLYFTASLLLKSALLILYLRIFRPSYRAKTLIWTSITVIVLFYTVSVVVDIAICAPDVRSVGLPNDISAQTDIIQVAAEYGAKQRENRCGEPQINIAVVLSVFSIVSDFYVLFIPIALVLKIRLSKKRKIGVCAIFLTGLIACGFSIAAAYYRFQLRHDPDFTWILVLNYALSAAEINVGIMCACMPVSFTVVNSFTKRGWDYVTKLVSSTRRTKDVSLNPSDANVADGTSRKMIINKVPRGTITGLQSLFSKTHHAQPDESMNMPVYNELGSVDETYHVQLKESVGTRGSSRV